MVLGTGTFRMATIVNSFRNGIEIRHNKTGNVINFEVTSNARKGKGRAWFVSQIIEGRGAYLGHIKASNDTFFFYPAEGEKAGIPEESPVWALWKAFWMRLKNNEALPSTWEVDITPIEKAYAPGRIKHYQK